MRSRVLAILFILPLWGLAQPATIMTWNLLNFDAFASNRVSFFTTVIDSLKPELLAVQEVEDQAGAMYFHQAVLDSAMGMAPYMEGPDSKALLFYDTDLFELVTAQTIPTALRNINWYTLKRNNATDTLHVFVAHLKAGSGTTNENQRLAEVNMLRQVTDQFSPSSYFIVCGDFNIYSGDEPAYQRLLEQDGELGYFIDPIGISGTWNTEAYAQHHTQSPRVRNFGGGASGGLDDRFDLILFSHSFGPSGDIQYMYNTAWAVGNDGAHYNDSINAMPNSSVSSSMANALHYASDHLPVVTSFRFVNETSVAEQPQGSTLSVVPNPSNGQFTVELGGIQQPKHYSVYDATGRLLVQDDIHGAARVLQVDLSAYSKGNFVLVVEGEKQRYNASLIKQ